MSSQETLTLRVDRVTAEAKDVVVLDLCDPDGGALPAFEPGSHLEVKLPNGLVRHYSLCGDSGNRDRYRIGIGLTADSRGGSEYLHQKVRAGAQLEFSAPRNNFPLVADAAKYRFVAGGIGITPIMAMIRWCVANDREWQLDYCVRSRQRAAFYEELTALAPDRVHMHCDDERGCLYDAPSRLGEVPADAYIYCCGPTPLMDAVKAATADREADRMHFEYFVAEEVDTSGDESFSVVLNSSGERFEVPPGKSILDVLEDNDEDVPFSCREGLCGTCITGVISGVPDHRDCVLSQADREANDRITVCCSRALSGELVLDL